MKTKTFLCAAILLIISNLQAQDATQIVNKYYESIGGLEKWRNLKTMKITAMVDLGYGMKTTETIYKKAPNLQRYESDSEEGIYIQTYDGISGWEQDSYRNEGDPQPLDKEIVNIIKTNRIEGNLIDYDKKGCTISYEGIEIIGDFEAYQIKMIKSDMTLEFLFFGIGDHHLLMSRRYEEAFGEEQESYYKDYRKVNGYNVPFLIESKLSGNLFKTTRVHEYIINEEIPDDMFRLY